jgi:hypothetical protein
MRHAFRRLFASGFGDVDVRNTANGSTPEEFRKLIDSDIALYSKVIREAEIRVD